MHSNCHNCKYAYENLEYIEGPCDLFGDESEDWEDRNVLEIGCKFWINKPLDLTAKCGKSA